MIIKVRIDKDDNKIFKLCSWSASSFNQNPVLELQTDNLQFVKQVFEKIETIEIIQANVLIAEYTLYDTYSSISYLDKKYVEHENIFADCLQIKLEKKSLAEQVQKLEEQLSNTIDIEAMSVDEYKEYVLKRISKEGSEDIQRGDYINGKLFTFDAYDQINLKTMYDMTIMYPQITMLPYHSSNGGDCMMYSAQELQAIYITLIVRELRLLTYINQLSQMIRSMTTKEELHNVYYGMDLVSPYAEKLATIVLETVDALGSIIPGYKQEEISSEEIHTEEEEIQIEENEEDSEEDLEAIAEVAES